MSRVLTDSWMLTLCVPLCLASVSCLSCNLEKKPLHYLCALSHSRYAKNVVAAASALERRKTGGACFAHQQVFPLWAHGQCWADSMQWTTSYFAPLLCLGGCLSCQQGFLLPASELWILCQEGLKNRKSHHRIVCENPRALRLRFCKESWKIHIWNPFGWRKKLGTFLASWVWFNLLELARIS